MADVGGIPYLAAGVACQKEEEAENELGIKGKNRQFPKMSSFSMVVLLV